MNILKTPIFHQVIFLFLGITFLFPCLALPEDANLNYTLDLNAATIALPAIFKPNIDLSGRGASADVTWPQLLAARESLQLWHKEIGFAAVYRLQYNLWEIDELAQDKEAQAKLLANYESVIKKISDAGGVVLLDLFAMPAGLGKVRDKKSAPSDLLKFKALVKKIIWELSVEKKYNIWYEVWSAPDLDDFFIGKRQEYLTLYRAVAESVREIRAQTKKHIPVGGPSTSWWFQNVDGNLILSPEKSLIYELIRYCYKYRLPLDFISWHSYTSDPGIETETTVYSKAAPALIRDWLSYFNLGSNTVFIVDEWNYDGPQNFLAERDTRSNIAASFIPARIKGMYEAGIQYQTYFCLEDFADNKEGVVRNLGLLRLSGREDFTGTLAKAGFNVFRMLSVLGNNLMPVTLKTDDKFAAVIATSSPNQEYYAFLAYNYIDPDISRNYVSRNISTLGKAERKMLLSMVKSGRFEKIMRKEIDLAKMRKVRRRLRALLKKAVELQELALKYTNTPRSLNLKLKNINGAFLYQRFTVDKSCAAGCDFNPVEEMDISAAGLFEQTFSLEPYSVNLIVLKKKPKAAVKAEADSSAEALPFGEPVEKPAQNLTPALAGGQENQDGK